MARLTTFHAGLAETQYVEGKDPRPRKTTCS